MVSIYKKNSRSPIQKCFPIAEETEESFVSLAGRRFQHRGDLIDHIEKLLDSLTVNWLLGPEDSFFFFHLCTYQSRLLEDFGSSIVGFKCGLVNNRTDAKCVYAIGKDGSEQRIDHWDCVDTIPWRGGQSLFEDTDVLSPHMRNVTAIDTFELESKFDSPKSPLLDAFVDELEVQPIKASTPRVLRRRPTDFGNTNDTSPTSPKRRRQNQFLRLDDLAQQEEVSPSAPSPTTPKQVSAWGGHLPVDGTCGSSTVKALQTFLRVRASSLGMPSVELPVDGEMSAATAKMLQMFLNAHWAEAGWQDAHLVLDGEFGPSTIRALQTFLNSRWKEASWRASQLPIDGIFGPATIKALQTFLNSNWAAAGWRTGQLKVDGLFGKHTVMALQILLTKHFGMTGKFGPRTIKALQTFLNTHWHKAGWRDQFIAVDGHFGPITIKALQTLLNSHWDQAAWRDEPLSVDGDFGSSSVKALQTYLNSVLSETVIGDTPWQRQTSPSNDSDISTPVVGFQRQISQDQETPKAVPAWSGQLGVDGKSDASTVKALQTFLKNHVEVADLVVDGNFDATTTTALQIFLNVRWAEAGWKSEHLALDGDFGPFTIKALQTFLNTHWVEASWRATPLSVDGIYGSSTVKALQTFLDSHWDEAGWRSGRLMVDGIFSTPTIMSLQTFLTKHFGMCGGFGARTIIALQTFLNTHWDEAGFRDAYLAVDGVFGSGTVKALQTFLNSHWDQAAWRAQQLTVDGEFGPASIKALQTYLNSVYDSVRGSLALRSAVKARRPAFSFFRKSRSGNHLEARRCTFAEEIQSEASHPRWYIDYVNKIEHKDWEKEEYMGAGLPELTEPESPNAIGQIVGTMLSDNTWYYLVERKNERRSCFDIVMRTYDDFERLDQVLSQHFGRPLMLKSEWLGLKRILKQEKFLEEHADALQNFLDVISKERALSNYKTVTRFMQPRYLAYQPRVVPKPESHAAEPQPENDEYELHL